MESSLVNFGGSGDVCWHKAEWRGIKAEWRVLQQIIHVSDSHFCIGQKKTYSNGFHLKRTWERKIKEMSNLFDQITKVQFYIDCLGYTHSFVVQEVFFFFWIEFSGQTL